MICKELATMPGIAIRSEIHNDIKFSSHTFYDPDPHHMYTWDGVSDVRRFCFWASGYLDEPERKK